jgi:putative ABC transport system permease protein
VRLWQNARISFRALRVNTLRTVLAVLGIVIGVAAVIAMVAVGSGAEARVAEQIKSLGSNLIVVRPGSSVIGGARLGAGTQLRITEDDAEAIEHEIDSVEAAAAYRDKTVQVVYGALNWATRVNGVTANYLDVRDWPLAAGRPIEVEDVRSAGKVALLGQTIVQNLFPYADPIGQIIRIANVPFAVIGVLKPKGQTTWGQDQDDTIVIPLSTGNQGVFGTNKSGPGKIDGIVIKTRPGEDMTQAESEIRDLLRQRQRLKPDQEDTFVVRNLSEVLRTQEEASRVMTYLLAAIASVSLLVGGIGIMNIMLVSVTERTREIGLRMAVGARGRHILIQFLVEAVTLSLIGGVLGVASGFAASWVISHLGEWPVFVPPEAVALAVAFAAAVGIFFGFYPARKAALLDPIEALRYE